MAADGSDRRADPIRLAALRQVAADAQRQRPVERGAVGAGGEDQDPGRDGRVLQRLEDRDAAGVGEVEIDDGDGGRGAVDRRDRPLDVGTLVGDHHAGFGEDRDEPDPKQRAGVGDGDDEVVGGPPDLPDMSDLPVLAHVAIVAAAAPIAKRLDR